jgi:hypothetical protein
MLTDAALCDQHAIADFAGAQHTHNVTRSQLREKHTTAACNVYTDYQCEHVSEHASAAALLVYT